MLEAMLHAPVGDDVFGEDPSVNELEEMTTAMFGMEAAIFCPSGTMTNQIAIKCHTQPGDEVICERLSHIYQYEGGGIAFNSGCSVSLLDGDRGRLTATQIQAAVNSDDVHKAHTSLVSLENTANRGGGSCYDMNELHSIKAVCRQQALAFHLDGARLWNALVARNETPLQYGALFDSISVCLSKGLGAPVGSLLLGTSLFIKKARRIRKVLGGGMRQAGFIAAGGKYALQHNVSRLAEDHDHARQVAAALARKEFIGAIMPVETNILIFEVKHSYTPQSFVTYLSQFEILCLPISATQVRMVFHLDVTPPMIQQLLQVIDHS